MEKPFLLVLDLRNSKNTFKNTWKIIQLKSERMRVESSRCHTLSLQNRHRTSSYFVASLRFRANEARGRRRARYTGDGGRCGKNNKYLCKCKFWQAKSNQIVEKSVNFNDPSLSNHWVTHAFDFQKAQRFSLWRIGNRHLLLKGRFPLRYVKNVSWTRWINFSWRAKSPGNTPKHDF